MYLRQKLMWSGLMLVLLCTICPHIVQAGMVGFPIPRQEFLRLRFEIAGDSFREDLDGSGDPEATTGRALATIAMGLTSWSELYARVGMAEFNIKSLGFNGDFGLAYGGGLRLRLAKFPIGSIGVTGQYLRLTSNDKDSAGERLEGEWEEIDAVLGFGTKQFGAFQFYLNAAYHLSDVTVETDDTNNRTTFDEDFPYRLVLGVHLFPLVDFPRNEFLVNFEARVIGETPQFTLGVQYAF